VSLRTGVRYSSFLAETYTVTHTGTVTDSDTKTNNQTTHMAKYTLTLHSINIQVTLLHLFFYSLPITFIALLYQEPISHILGQWHTLGGAHFPLLIAVSLYLIWIQRSNIRSLQPEPALVSGTLVLATGCFILFAGKIGSTILVQQVSIVPVLLGVILLLGGFSYFKYLFLPVSYLIFLTGCIDYLLGSFAIYFQQITAWISTLLLRAAGFSVFRDEILIMMPHISLLVVSGCSGVNQIVTLLALAVPLAFMTQSTLVRKIILISSALIIGIVVNGMRVAMIGIYALYDEGASLHGPYETFAASVIFFFGFGVMILFSMVLNRTDKNRRTQEDNSPPPDKTQQQFESSDPEQKSFSGKRLASYLFVIPVLALTLGLVHYYHPRYVELESPLTLIPSHMAGFSAWETDDLDQRLRPFPAHEELMRVYEDGQNNRIELYIGYFGIQDRERKIIDYRRSWMHRQVSRQEVAGSDNKIAINKSRRSHQSSESDVYFWYQMDHRIIRNQYAGKFFTFTDTLLKRKNNAAVVVIRARGSDHRIMYFLEEAVPLIKTHLSGRS